ncbi:hypothetical protein DLJ53_15485 [Acuticoccus sediminis]|uniref:Fatty acid hydroxylase domain-containing protein n=1 Tax=Acuticoccus sediminis TaxID=2184697 RepID=A0A8B2NXZ9_9HYPH|nr:sterol desaturase family protein [Acuticoccus sediminis]RAI00658.1 hypothetical protein DLJ53_15485 [Acuticoccus sediminis]
MALAESPRTMSLRDALDNRLIRKIAKVWTPLLSLILVIAIVSSDSLWTVALSALIGFVYYSFLEYAIHRWHLHSGPYRMLVRRMTFDLSRMHLDHHKEPAHPKGAVNQQKPAFVVTVVSSLIAFVLPIPYEQSFAFIFGAATCYVANDLMHFAVHHLPMNGPVLGWWKRHHMLHHYRDDDANFATIMPLWDKFLGSQYKGPTRPAR